MNVLVVFVAYLLSSVTAMTWPGVPVAHNEKCSTLGRIVNGMTAKDHQFPWYVTVRSHTPDGLQSICGGSIVSPIWILTAAHCTHGFISYTIGFGSNKLNAPLITMHTYDVVEHIDYNVDNLNNDIAMIRLPSPLTFSPIIQSIRMPKLSESAPDDLLHTKAQVCGYGRTDEHSKSLSETLNWVEKRIIENSQCSQTYGPTVILPSTICAVGWLNNDESTCNGDSGGPLAIDDGGVYVQIGIVSFVSNKGCSSGHPAGYVRISSYLEWIAKIAHIPLR